MMLLRDLLAPWFHYAGAESINGLTLDSRHISAGMVFVALPGYQVDGRQYINAAILQGATAVLAHTDEPKQHAQVDYVGAVPVIHFCQLVRQLSAVAAQCYPIAQPLKVIGVTGTNGKTSVSQIIAQLVTLYHQKAAVMGTLGNGLWGQLVDSGNTTADAITVIRQLADYAQQGADVCAMEVSSHGLVQGRVEAVPFKTAVFTNLSRDHLDYHGDMSSYSAAKKRLFQFASLENGLINIDDPVGAAWLVELNNSTLKSFSIDNPIADFYCQNTIYDDAGIHTTLVVNHPQGSKSFPLSASLLGKFNLANLIAALAALSLQGFSMVELVKLAAKVQPVAGRMERFSVPNKPTLVVDYAHTPDAIEQVLQALRVHCKGQLWCVFGCGGDRDKGKRPLMAQAAEKFADKVMVTSDNARSEQPQRIIDDVMAGLMHPQNALCEIDRVTAIKQVVSLAQANDIVLLAGKGHETYQEIAGKRLQYDERALAQKLMEEQA
ncbi:UDP-N-acetylmuramoyl-L-alanyl-D-glutamate--2,6-diaminopimelate ligase [Shewanella aestuarii]|uniref:UDP-N-acetylmuramyl-tripeptide synthetase n=1 Tax=Shewanella aestuarii TaxID=1028752 RepID=A0A6G9QP68_9GAMM|nr:UDP-N-acetylmuramoyl-L-alanyl-D-glutamate--2,6-diaminopimelate ligase [Shewanella aestuarii]QIR15847.1 UDP-N-acetylmuramoyl-L-alanyl-D-glutamate--2,6-diaminopimelate ligase [Shewanella aestuarii]